MSLTLIRSANPKGCIGPIGPIGYVDGGLKEVWYIVLKENNYIISFSIRELSLPRLCWFF